MTSSRTRNYPPSLLIFIALTIVAVGLIAYAVYIAKEGSSVAAEPATPPVPVAAAPAAAPATPAAPAPTPVVVEATTLPDLPSLPDTVSWDLIWGLNATAFDAPPVVSGETPLRLTAVRTNDNAAQNRHALALRFSGLDPGAVYRATVWVKSADTNIQLQVRDSEDPQTGKPPDQGEVRFNLKTGAATMATGNLLAHGIDAAPDGWSTAWVELKSQDGKVFVYLGLIEKNGTSNVFAGTGEQVLLGGIAVAPKP
jgi:hypothetical protein